MKQPLITGCLIRPCLLRQHIEIRAALLPSGKRRDIVFVSGFLQDLPQQLMHRRIRNDLPEFIHLSQAALQFLPDLLVAPFCLVTYRRFTETHVSVFGSHTGKLFLCHAAETRRKHRRQRDILLPVIQYPKIVKQHADLLGSKVSFPGSRIRRDPFSVQHLREYIGESHHTPCQDHDIRIPDTPEFPGLLINYLEMFPQTADPSCDRPCLQLTLRDPSIFPSAAFSFQVHSLPQSLCLIAYAFRSVLFPFFHAAVDHQYLCLRILPGLIIGSHIQRRLFIISDPAEFLRHDLPEDIIHTVQDLFSAAEVLVQVDPLLLHRILFLSVCVIEIHRRIRMEFLHEKLRS